VLDGEPAVPCNLQSAIAGLNSLLEVFLPPFAVSAEDGDGLSPAQWATAEPRQDRKVAAVSGFTMCRRFAWLESTAGRKRGAEEDRMGVHSLFNRKTD